MNKEIIFLTTFSKKIGFGHLNRCFNFQKIIKSKYKKTVIYSIGKEKYKNVKKIKKINNLKNRVIIIDLPKIYLNKYEFLKENNRLLLIDNFLNHRNVNCIIPTVLPINNKKNIKSGKDWVILNPNINRLRNKKVKQNSKAIILYGGSLIPSVKEILYFKNHYSDYLFILGPLVEKKKINFFKENNIKFTKNPTNLFYLIKSSKYIFTRYGITMYEILSLKKKPIIFVANEKYYRLREINFLKKKKIIDIFHTNKKNFNILMKKNYEIKTNHRKILNLINKLMKHD